MSAPQITLLIVDDDDDVREMLAAILELEGFRVVTAADGRQGFEAMKTLPRPCAALLDLRMPVMNGWETIEALRADGRLGEVPIVICTSAPADAPQGFALVTKPVDLPELISKVQKLAR
jgi:CheY-like chemotaxis protein